MSFCSLHSGFHWLSLPLSGSQLLWNFAYMVLARLTRPSCSALTSLQISTFSVTTFCYYSTAKPIFKFFWDLNILSLVKGTIISGMEYVNSLSIFLIDFCSYNSVYSGLQTISSFKHLNSIFGEMKKLSRHLTITVQSGLSDSKFKQQHQQTNLL